MNTIGPGASGWTGLEGGPSGPQLPAGHARRPARTRGGQQSRRPASQRRHGRATAVVVGVLPGVYLGSSDNEEAFRRATSSRSSTNWCGAVARAAHHRRQARCSVASRPSPTPSPTTRPARLLVSWNHHGDRGVRRERLSPPVRLRDRVRREPLARSRGPPGRVRQRGRSPTRATRRSAIASPRSRRRRRSVPFAEPGARRGADLHDRALAMRCACSCETWFACRRRSGDGPLRGRFLPALLGGAGLRFLSDVAAYTLLRSAPPGARSTSSSRSTATRRPTRQGFRRRSTPSRSSAACPSASAWTSSSASSRAFSTTT